MQKHVSFWYHGKAVDQKILIKMELPKTTYLGPFASVENATIYVTHKLITNRVTLLQCDVTLNQIMVGTLWRYERNVAILHSKVQKNRLLLSDLISCCKLLCFTFNCQNLKVLIKDCSRYFTLSRKICSLFLFWGTTNHVIPCLFWIYC